MSPIDFKVLSMRSEKAVSLTRNARDMDRENARKIGETAAQVLHGIVQELSRARAHAA